MKVPPEKKGNPNQAKEVEKRRRGEWNEFEAEEEGEDPLTHISLATSICSLAYQLAFV